ncbi:MAG: hypothetical protein AABW50_02175 [Nanoarchaeota archaeon]
MQHMMYLNLFERVTRIRTNNSFVYNDTIFFSVPRQLVARAIGENGKNTKNLSHILNKKIKVIASPKGIEDIRQFVQSIISPVTFKNIEVRDNEAVLSASMQSKAAIIGRNKRRLLEMQKIISDFFGLDFRVG